ncbi:MAG: hypothetical protein J6A21_09570 [Lentisphaeria bacterium]|nr:hypothetical protein [Lentisphaeria bacterium]
MGEAVKQKFSSGNTSLRQVAAGFRKIDFAPGTVNLDLGGGKFDEGTKYLAEKGVKNLVFDPVNRSEENNREVFRTVSNGGVDTVSCNNVLNVIREASARDNVILQAAKALKENGTAYFTVYEGDGSGQGRQTQADAWQENRKAADYLEEIRKHFSDVQLKNKVITARGPLTEGKVSVWSVNEKFDADLSLSLPARMEEEKADTEKLFKAEKEGVLSRIFGVFRTWRTPARGEKKDISGLSSVLKNAYYQGLTLPTFGRIMEQAVQMDSWKSGAEHAIYNGNSKEDLRAEFASWQVRNKKEYARLNEYLLKTDADRESPYACTLEKKTAKGKIQWQVKRKGKVLGAFATEQEALSEAFRKEMEGVLADGWNPETAKYLYWVRNVFARQYDLMVEDARKTEEEYRKSGEEIPEEFASIFDELRKMGDLRTTYFPRIRKIGSYLVYSVSDTEKRMEKFATKAGAALHAEKMKHKGYAVQIVSSDQSSEDLYSDLNVAAMNETLLHAADRLKGTKTLSWEDIGFTAGMDHYKEASGKVTDYFTLTGYKSGYEDLMKKFGGQWFTGSGMWRFKRLYNNPKGQQALLKALSLQSGIVQNEKAIMTKNLMAQVADVIRMHGSRSHMIHRGAATGEDVVKGYEEDLAKAMALSVSAVAGGYAKKQGYAGMMRAFMGTDESFSDFLKKTAPEMVKDPASMTEEELARLGELYEKYMDDVREKMIDSAKQPNAYRLAQNFIRDMMRNETSAEHVMGYYKAVCGLFFLSRPSSGIINLTTMGINVPAVMSDRLGIGIARSLAIIAKESKNFLAFKAGKLADKDLAYVYERMPFLGLGQAEMDKDVARTVMTWGNRSWQKLMEYGMICFAKTEEFNRSVTTAAAYRVLLEQAQKKLKEGETLTDAQKDALIQKANYLVTLNAHGVYGKLGTPDAIRGTSLLATLGRNWYTYKNYQHNTWQLCWDYVTRGKWKELAYVSTSGAAIGGLRASPAAALAFFVMGIAGSGWEPPEGYEEAYYKWLRKVSGETPERLARMGIAGLLGMDLRGSMGMEVGVSALPRTYKDFLGAPYSFAEGVAQGAYSLAKGDLYNAAQKLLPSAAATAVRAVQERIEGVQRKGKAELYEGEPIRPDSVDMVLRMLGFNPAAISEKRERNRTMRSVRTSFQKERSELREDLRRWYRTTRSRSAYLELFQRIQRYNEKAKLYNEKPITEADIQSALKKAS